MIVEHFYARYGLALVMQRYNLEKVKDIIPSMLISLLQEGMDHFRLQPRLDSEDNGSINFQYAESDFLKNNPKYIKTNCNEGYFLAPHVITKEINASINWNAQDEIISRLSKLEKLDKRKPATMSIMPLTSKINNGNKSQSVPSVTLFEAALLMIATSNPLKPSLYKKDNQLDKYSNCTIIPDLELPDLVKFISVFQDMLKTQTNNLFLGKIKRDKEIKFYRPRIKNGNFPYAPFRSELASAALLGAIGWFSKQAEYPNSLAEEVLDKLQERPLYIITYGKAKSVHFNHYIVNLAKNNLLCNIIDSITWFRPFINNDEKNDKNSKIKLNNYFLFVSRFLQLFDKESFKEFLSIRGEYNIGIIELIKTFFRRVMKIDQEVINSAAVLGKWLNNIAYFTAKNEVEENNKEAIIKGKAKIIVEIESAAFSAKTPSALVAQVITRAGRISAQDAPIQSKLFIQKVLEGNLGENEKISLENAKNMIVVFARISGNKESQKFSEKVNSESEIELELAEEENIETELSDDELE